MLEYLKNDANEIRTANGAKAFASTKSFVLDLFSMGGAFRNRSDKEIRKLFSKAFAENPLLAMKTLFYLRDITEGQGERRFFRVALKHLALHNKEALRKNLHLVPKFGRYDDLWVLLETDLKDDVIDLVRKQLSLDKNVDHPSLLGKWLPSLNASSHKTKKYAKIIQEGLGLTPRQYRKMLSALRAKINIVETKLTERDYESIDYSKIPSRAGLIYRNAFYRNDRERYVKFLDNLIKGKAKINTKTLYPYDIVRKALEGYGGRNIWSWGKSKELTPQEIQLLDSQWNNLPDFIGERKENSIAVVDTSGSMAGTPIEVAISLGIYLAERNKGVFHNHFFTFSNKPQLQQIVGSNIVEKVRNLSNSDWGNSTNVEAVFRKILNVAVKNNLPQDEMIGKVIIISDMQFNHCTRGVDTHIFKQLEKDFNEAGYKMPLLTFWNVNAFQSNTQFTMNESGVELVSGFSPSIFKNVLSNVSKTPYELMLEVIDSERYSEVTV
jgi:hypothetical protein